jgi:hypothetical protein
MKVSDILRVKGNTLYTLGPDHTLWAAVQTMAVLEEQGLENRMLKAYIRDWPEQESVSG